MNPLLALWALFRFTLRYGPTAVLVAQKILALIDRMSSPTDQGNIGQALARILALKDPKQVRIDKLNDLLCTAQSCHTR